MLSEGSVHDGFVPSFWTFRETVHQNQGVWLGKTIHLWPDRRKMEKFRKRHGKDMQPKIYPRDLQPGATFQTFTNFQNSKTSWRPSFQSLPNIDTDR